MLELMVIIAFVLLIIILIKKNVEIGVTLLASSLFLILTLNPWKLYPATVETLLSSKTWYLILTSTAIAIIAELYRVTTLIRDLGISLAKMLHSPKLAVVITPAVIGLLPVAGGALMSAPLVEALSPSLNFTPDQAIYANVWFRHTIFLFYPLSTLMITTSAITGIPIENLAIKQLPVSIFMIIIGYLIAFRNNKKTVKIKLDETKYTLKASITPLLTALTAAVTLRILIGNFGMPIGVLIGIISLIIITKPTKKTILETINNKRVKGIALAAFSIMYLQEIFTASGAANILTQTITQQNIPPILLEYTVPGILSLITGSNLTGVVITVPIIEAMKQLTALDVTRIYVSSYLYYIPSPVHLCYVYTAKYFNKPLTGAYRYLLPSAILSIIFAIIYFAINP